jgi:L-threonylcarbamoyladenylate synthase
LAFSRIAFVAALRKTSFVQTVLTPSPKEAAQFLTHGGIVAFPTETVYGLGANIFDESAIRKIFEAKQRPADNPLIAHISSVDQIAVLATEVTESAAKLIAHFFPGPLTVVLQKRDAVPSIATAGLDSIGLRMPRNNLANELISACGIPLVAPSANLSGRPSPTTWQAVLEDLDGRIDCILQGDPTEIGLESTVVDCRTNIPYVLRLGAVPLRELQSVVSSARLATGDSESPARSPGLRHKHYSPKARVVIWSGGSRAGHSTAFIGLNKPEPELAYTKVVVDVDEYARSLYEFFRECDRRGIETIYCESVEENDIGAALMDRLRRAAK